MKPRRRDCIPADQFYSYCTVFESLFADLFESAVHHLVEPTTTLIYLHLYNDSRVSCTMNPHICTIYLNQFLSFACIILFCQLIFKLIWYSWCFICFLFMMWICTFFFSVYTKDTWMSILIVILLFIFKFSLKKIYGIFVYIEKKKDLQDSIPKIIKEKKNIFLKLLFKKKTLKK